jgi:hypothetical protein
MTDAKILELKMKTRPPVEDFIDWEEGEMNEERAVEFFQRLINTGMAWTLQGSYGRQAQALIEAGMCTPKQS